MALHRLYARAVPDGRMKDVRGETGWLVHVFIDQVRERCVEYERVRCCYYPCDPSVGGLL